MITDVLGEYTPIIVNDKEFINYGYIANAILLIIAIYMLFVVILSILKIFRR